MTTTPTKGAGVAETEKRSNLQRSGDWARRMPLLPAMVLVFLVTQLPFLFTIGASFMNWNAYYPDERRFNGGANFKTVLTDPAARKAIWVTVLLTAAVVLISLFLGLIIALLLDRKFFGQGIVRTMMITPFLVVPVAAALLWKHALYNPEYGLFNGMLTKLFGENAPQPDWISEHPMWAVIFAIVWQWTPFMMLILLAGLQSRPMDVVEAAKIDGASSWQIFRSMTLPHLRPYMELSGLLGTIYVVQNFDHVFTITGGGLGTANLPYYIYTTFYTGQDYGLASAAGVVVVILTIIVSTVALRTVFSIFREEQR
ncbi:carbohydrate ABC transporter permease [Nostocoides australiense]|uniref:Binding-protein-dependent transport systems inner membrane component n=1 Tax=Nostocoides australiense Ben110 TaxID=1193182 RepID=W6K2V1_9MICO|nr:sugar ABC transporter permease [Actinomycetota bacterium]MCB1301257.1 sugar ABC transporter permease [Tetrasphaera sp.]CCH75455.1 Binding-protein-dependent transport systems inner membrane component [Tetrasphaera australiensis Ben110]